MITSGKIRFSVASLHLTGTSKVTQHLRNDGGCGKPSSGDETREGEWTVTPWAVTFEAPAGSDPDTQAGSIKNEAGETITWKLTRVRM